MFIGAENGRMDESDGFIHYVQVDDLTNIAQIAAEHRWKCAIDVSVISRGMAFLTIT
jgi:hypothetical protein